MLLTGYQKQALAYTFKTQHPALFMDMRLGKSVVYSFRAKSYPGKNLIVCPLSAFDGWLKCFPDAIVLYGERKERLKRLYVDGKFFIINWDGFRVIPEIKCVEWNSICLDESTQIKNPRSRITKFFLKNFRSVSHRWILTGTPDTENSMDLICQLNFLNQEILKINYWEFRERFCYMKDYMKFSPTSMGSKLLAKGLNHAFNKTRKDVDFPCEKIYENRYLELPQKIRKLYDQCEKEFLIEYKGNRFDLKTLWHIQKVIWMRLLTSGLLDGKCVWREKIEAVREIIESTSESIIVWATYKDEYVHLKKSFKKALSINGDIHPREREPIIKKFNKNGGVIILQPDCFKFGADLSKASIMIYFSQPNSLITKTQTEDRAIHLTKNCPVMIYNIIVKNSIDEDMIEAFQEKREDSKRLRRLSGLLK